jgi:excinuclease ABC subunit A
VSDEHIRIENARSHNLKGVSCRIPLGRLTVVTGVSGSGKSTLAFDTLYAEGQRRYVTSLSTYARQFLERLPRPEVDFISNLPPAIAIEQAKRVQNARSTVGTASEIVDLLRLLFSKIGETRCLDCDLPARAGGVVPVAERILAQHEGERLVIAAPLLARAKETFRERRNRLLAAGFARIVAPDGEVLDVSELTLKALKAHWNEAVLLIDRLVPKPGADRARLVESVASAFREGFGCVIVFRPGEARSSFRQGFACDRCGKEFREPTPALFSFNSPLGACDACSGFGRTAELDWERVVPNGGISLAQGAVAPFATPSGKGMQRDLIEACETLGIPVDRPFADLSKQQRNQVFEGDDDADWYGVRGYFDWLEGRRYRVQARTQLARYRCYETCLQCCGTRLSAAANGVLLGGQNIGEVSRLSIASLSEWLAELELSSHQQELSGRVIELLTARLSTSEAVGLGYMTLDRQLRTLSGGEAQRIQLATALGGSLTSVLYVLDEPSIGLHAKDMGQLLGVLRSIRDQGNTVVVVEHAREVVEAADHVIDLGPGGGREGGVLVVEGTVEQVAAHPTSWTGRALRGEFSGAVVERRGADFESALTIVGASEHNLTGIDVAIPLAALVAVTGVSGAGKSTLVHSVLVGNLVRDLPEQGTGGSSRNLERGACERIEGLEHLDRVVVVEQSAVSRSPRSNPATVSKAFEGIRKAFAGTREARAAGIGPGWFSFNVVGGRCDECEGSGVVVIDMQFLDDVRVPCEACAGQRYRVEVLELQYRGRSIAEVLALSLDDAVEVFSDHGKIVTCLEPLIRVGLGYLSLGQPLSTLSGGEHQRMRLALALAQGAHRTLYVLDEPTTGLHPRDIDVLMSCLRELIDAGGSVLLVEHNLEVIAQADHVIDLGPEGGPGGGRVIAEGTPLAISRVPESHTGRALLGILTPDSPSTDVSQDGYRTR